MPEIAKAFGPGDDHPASPAAGERPTVSKALGPGDADPRSPQGTAGVLLPPPGPGDSVGDPEDEYEYFTPPAAGPGDDAFGPRHLGRVLKPKPITTVAVAPVVAADVVAVEKAG